MIRRSFFFLLIILPPMAQAQTLYHVPPAGAVSGQTVEFEAILVGQGTVVEAKVFHRTAGQNGFHETRMALSAGVWRTVVSPEFVTEQGLEYSIIFNLDNGSSVAFPQDGPLESPHFLNVTPAPERTTASAQRSKKTSSKLKADILVISPEEGGLVTSKEVLIAASLFNVDGVDSSAVRLSIDNRDITLQAAISSETVTCSVSDLEDGLHTVRIEMTNIYGYDLQPVTWSFNVGSAGEALLAAVEEFKYSGKIRSDASLDRVGDQVLSIGQTATNFEAGWEWFNVKANVRLATDESVYRQARNRYSLTVRSGKNVSIMMGDFTPVLSPYTIEGKRVRGLGIDIDLNWLRFQMVKGELERAVQGFPTLDRSHQILEVKSDGSGQPVYMLDRMGYTFTRYYTAYKLSTNLFNKFRFGVNVQKAKDLKDSVQPLVNDAEIAVPDWTDFVTEAGIDSGIYTFEEFEKAIDGVASYELAEGNWGGASPQDNIVAGFESGLNLDDGRLTLESGWAISLLNRNIWDGAMTKAKMDTVLDDTLDGYVGRQYDDDGQVSDEGLVALEDIPIDPEKFRDWFIVNINMVPLIPIDPQAVQETPVAAFMNMPSTAYNFKMKAYYYGNTIQLRYSQVGPEFTSLGNPYLTSNLREFVVSDRVRLFDNKLSLSYDYKSRNNEILRTVVDPYSQKTSSTNISFAPGAGMPSFTGSFQTVNRTNSKTDLDTLFYATAVGEDSIAFKDRREDTRTSNKFFSVNVPLSSENRTYNILVTYNSVEAEDLLVAERAADYRTTFTNSQSLSIVGSIKFARPLKTSFTFSRYAVQIPLPAELEGQKNESRLTTLGFDASYGFWQEKARLRGGSSLLNATGISEFTFLGMNAGLEFKPFKPLSTRLTLSTKIKKVADEVELGTLAVKFSLNYVF
ncbi:MAG: hypothetical protein QF551_01810 [Candidatus Marinimicrobia bacterium]|jgi:hypothetical protein|nr:hypothetical protein [Candidatus Neomarinimicrobiota bacterium]